MQELNDKSLQALRKGAKIAIGLWERNAPSWAFEFLAHDFQEAEKRSHLKRRVRESVNGALREIGERQRKAASWAFRVLKEEHDANVQKAQENEVNRVLDAVWRICFKRWRIALQRQRIWLKPDGSKGSGPTSKIQTTILPLEQFPKLPSVYSAIVEAMEEVNYEKDKSAIEQAWSREAERTSEFYSTKNDKPTNSGDLSFADIFDIWDLPRTRRAFDLINEEHKVHTENIF